MATSGPAASPGLDVAAGSDADGDTIRSRPSARAPDWPFPPSCISRRMSYVTLSADDALPFVASPSIVPSQDPDAPSVQDAPV